MSRATQNFVDGNVGRPLDHPDAIITGADNGSAYPHIVGVANMDAIGVWAICRGKHMEPL